MSAHPVLLVALGAAAAWAIFRPKTANAKVSAEAGMPKISPPKKEWKIDSTPAAKAPTLDDSPSAHAGNYLTHLSNAAEKVAILHGGAETHEESETVNQAYADLSAPMDVLTVQKDLNVLGASPALVEDGVYGPKTKDAIGSFQSVMGLSSTGTMDAQTNNALRRSVVAVTSQSIS